MKSNQNWPAASVETRSVEQLIPYANNARTHSTEQIKQIAASMKEWGWTMPVLIDESNSIIAGHGRIAAAELLEIAEVPVMVARGWSQAQKKAYVIADNKLAENASWDEELLRLELNDLNELGFDGELMGFDSAELDSFLNIEEGETAADDVPEMQEETVSSRGDLWQLGDHRLLCGDSTNPDEVALLMGEQLADMAFTDPPYNVDYVGRSEKTKTHKIKNDNLGDSFYDFLFDAIKNLLKYTKGACYISMSSSELDILQKAFRDAGGKWSTFIIWAKHTFSLGRSDYHRQYEPILYGWSDGGKHYWCGDRSQGDVWNFKKPHKSELHPTMKPVELVEHAIKNSSKGRDIVLDLFGGSGTTIIAAERTGRFARCMELDPKYMDVIVRRWQEYTGQQAVLSSDNVLFDDLEKNINCPS